MKSEQESTGTSATKQRRGIVDWEIKKKALSVLFGGAWSKKELVAAILGTTASEDGIASVMAGLSKWDSHKPKHSAGRLFVTSLVRRLQELGSTEPNLAGVIVDGTYDVFLESIPPERRRGLPAPSTGPVHQEMVNDDDPYHHV